VYKKMANIRMHSLLDRVVGGLDKLQKDVLAFEEKVDRAVRGRVDDE